MSLFASAEQGTWYDPSDYSTLFQDSAGTTPVTAVEQAVGLILDKSKGLVLGSELVSTANTASVWGAFGTNTATQDGDAVKITYGDNSSGGFVYLRLTSGSNLGGLSTNLTIGRTYRVTAEVRCNTGGLILVVNNGSVNAEIAFTSTSYVTYTFNVTILAANPYLQIRDFGAGEIGFIRNISVRELLGNHAIQPTAASRPILRARYNQLTHSEQFDNAAWGKTNIGITADATTAPDGTTTADKLTETSVTGSFLVSGSAPVIASTRLTLSVFAKASERRYLRVLVGGAGWNGYCAFDLQDGVAGTPLTNSGTNVAATIVAAGNGFYRCAVTVTPLAGVATANVQIGTNNSLNANDNSYAGSAGSGLFLWGADLRYAADTYLPYQRIEAATDYDTVGFPTYLSYDGSDDSMYTGGNLDLSGTDKLTVFAGVTKLSDVAQGMFAELGNRNLVQAGSFSLTAPRVSAIPNYGFISEGSAVSNLEVATFAAPITSVLTASAEIATDTNVIRVNGVQAGSATADQGTGNFGSYPLNMGRRNNASLPFNGRLYQLIVRGAATSAALITQTERWIAAKQGRTL